MYTIQHTHAHHTHTHDSIYASVYTYTHCGHTDYLAKFCYDKIHALNFAIKNVWLGKVLTLMDPRKFGYQKSLLLYLM